MADLIIRGMEMPEYCYECPCHNGESGYCQAYKSGYLYSIERPAKCPIVPLPEGHGRLIDAEAFNDYMQIRYDNNEITNGDWIDFRLAIKDQPTIVPAEGGGEG